MKHLVVLALSAAVTFALAPMAHAVPVTFIANLDGPSEDPPNNSPGTGFAQVDFDLAAHAMRVQVTFTGLAGTTTAAHIHAPTAVAGAGIAGVATQVPTFGGFPLGVTSGVYDMTFDMTLAGSYNPSFITANVDVAGAETALFDALMDGKAYFNIHSTLFPGGEIRGFLHALPEPATLALVGLGLAGLGLARRRRRYSTIE